MKNSINIEKNYKRSEECILKLLVRKLPKDRYYHNPGHTLDVINVSERLARLEGISPEDRDFWIIKTGALIHDVGHIFTYQGHEEKSAEFAKELLGYRKRDRKKISKIALATKLPQSPKTLCEKIVCDADVDNFGRDDFFDKGALIRRELEAQGIEMSDEDWYKGTLKLLDGHHYFTDSARKLRQEKKEQNIIKLKNILQGI